MPLLSAGDKPPPYGFEHFPRLVPLLAFSSGEGGPLAVDEENGLCIFCLITNAGRRGAVPYGLRLFPPSVTDLAFLVGRGLAPADNKGVRFHNAV